MAIPNRPAQIARVAEFLEDPSNDERSVQDVAKLIVNGIYDAWMKDMDTPPQVPVVGKAFTWPCLTKVYHVAWIGPCFNGHDVRDVVWLVSEDSGYGMLANTSASLWRLADESPDRRRKKEGPRPGSPGYSSDGWKPGMKVSHSQRMRTYDILAVGDKSNLLREVGTQYIQSESSANLAKYYTRERS